jgi:hypothetical protein
VTYRVACTRLKKHEKKRGWRRRKQTQFLNVDFVFGSNQKTSKMG